MDKIVIKRGAIMAGLIALILGLSYACSLVIDRDVTPVLTDPDGVFVETGDLTITNEAWYEAAKNADGITQLLNMVDESLLEASMAAVSQDEIDETILELTYGTSDTDEINALSDLEFERANQEYSDLVLVSGFDPDDPESVERFVRLSIAKENVVKDRLKQSINESDEDFNTLVEDFYEASDRGRLDALTLRFRSADEMDAILTRLSIVLDYEGGWGFYEGDTPMDDVPSDGFDETNTRALSDSEVLTLFMSMYEYIYPFKAELPDGATRSELAASDMEDLMYDYDVLSEDANENLQSLLDYMFDSLRASDNFYSTSSFSVGSERALVYVLEDNPAPLFDELDQARQGDLETEYLDSLLDEETLNTQMAAYRDELGFQIHDTVLAGQYESFASQESFEDGPNDATVASVGEMSVTVDDFFDYMAKRVGSLYAIDLIRDELLLSSDYFEALYGDNRDLFDNNTDAMVEFRDQIRQDKLAFSNGSYAQYGFTPEDFTWEEFLEAGYGLESEYDYLLTLALTDVREAFINERLDVSESLPYVEENHEYYMSLLVDQLLLFVDMDNDFEPDDFDEYYDSLDEDAQTLVDQKVARFEDLVADAIESGQTMRDILDSFNEGLRGESEDDADYSEFAALKNEGFYLLYEDLSPEGEEGVEAINFESAKSYVKPFLDGLRDFYNDYRSPENQNLDSLLNDDLIRTPFGLHIIQGEPGPAFDQPSTVPTEENIQAYQAFIQNNPDLEASEIEAGLRSTLGDDVYEGIEAYYTPVNDAFFSSNYFNALMIEDILSDTTFTSDDTYHTNILDTLGQVFRRRSLPILQSEIE